MNPFDGFTASFEATVRLASLLFVMRQLGLISTQSLPLLVVRP